MRFGSQYRSEHFGAVEINELQRVIGLDSGFRSRKVRSRRTHARNTQHRHGVPSLSRGDSTIVGPSLTTTPPRRSPSPYSGDRGMACSEEDLASVESQMVIVVSCMNEELEILEGVLLGVPHHCLIVLVSNSSRGPDGDKYAEEVRCAQYLQRPIVCVHQRDPGVAAALQAAGMSELVEVPGDGSRPRVRAGKGEAMILGVIIAKLTSRKYVGFVDADNYVPGSVTEYCRIFAAGLWEATEMGGHDKAMVRISWHSKPKPRGDRIHFEKVGRSSQVVNSWLNKLLDQLSSQQYQCQSPIPSRAPTPALAPSSPQLSIEEYDGVQGTSPISIPINHFPSDHESDADYGYNSDASHVEDEASLSPLGLGLRNMALHDTQGGNYLRPPSSAYSVSPSVASFSSSIASSIISNASSTALPGHCPKLVVTGNAGEHAMTLDLALSLKLAGGYAIEPYELINILEQWGSGIMPTSAAASPVLAPSSPQSTHSVASSTASTSVRVLQIQSRNPHFHDGSKGPEHIQRMQLQALRSLYHSPLVSSEFQENLRNCMRDDFGQQETSIEPAQERIYPAIGTNLDFPVFFDVLVAQSESLRQISGAMPCYDSEDEELYEDEYEDEFEELLARPDTPSHDLIGSGRSF